MEREGEFAIRRWTPLFSAFTPNDVRAERLSGATLFTGIVRFILSHPRQPCQFEFESQYLRSHPLVLINVARGGGCCLRWNGRSRNVYDGCQSCIETWLERTEAQKTVDQRDQTHRSQIYPSPRAPAIGLTSPPFKHGVAMGCALSVVPSYPGLFALFFILGFEILCICIQTVAHVEYTLNHCAIAALSRSATNSRVCEQLVDLSLQ